MIALLTYFIKMLICSGVLYGYYALAFKNNPFHRWNRGYLLLATIASILLPLLQFSFAAAPLPAYTMPMVMVYGYMSGNAQQAANSNISAWLMPGIYSLIVLLLLANILRNYLFIKRLARQGQQLPFNNYRIIRHEQVKSTFSFFNDIFWGEELTPDSHEGKQVLRHELEHIQGRHTADKLFMQLVCAICWANPFFHLLRKELAMVHEFLADKAAATEDAADDYARTLLQMALQTKRMLMANSFAHAPIKRRILMLFTHKTNHALMKKLIIIPLALLLAFFIGCQQDIDLKKTVAANANISAATVLLQDPTAEVLTFVSDPPTFPGGEKALMTYLAGNIRYPKLAQESNITGTIFVQFVVRNDGTVTDIKTVGKTLGNGLEEESIRVVKGMPKWNPGKNEGKLVNVAFNLPIRYTLN